MDCGADRLRIVAPPCILHVVRVANDLSLELELLADFFAKLSGWLSKTFDQGRYISSNTVLCRA
jgi:hypothetical protein